MEKYYKTFTVGGEKYIPYFEYIVVAWTNREDVVFE